MSDALEKVARAIYEAKDNPRYSLYDYSTHPGSALPHVIIDNLEKGVVYRFEREADAASKFFLLCRAEVARAAIAAYEAATTEHIEIGKPSPIYGIPVQGTWSQSGFKPLPDINRIRELEEALRPFAIVAEYIDTHCPDAPDSDETGIGIGDLRRARAVLEGKNDGR